MKTSITAATFAMLATFAGTTAFADDFSYSPPGTLQDPGASGRFDETVYAPAMRFPIESAPAFANSQVYGHGGSEGPGGSQCDVENFSYPWWDNYCERRQWDMPLCPSGTGHQGQDIRAASCEKLVHSVVAAESGTVTSIGSYSVYITAADGTRYDYLHMGALQVTEGQEVQKGEHIGMVSNEFGGTPTSVHLHFNLRQNVAGVGNVYVPPYLSLVGSYQSLIGPPPTPANGTLDASTCEAIRGWTQSPTDPEAPIDVRLTFDGVPGDGATIAHPFLADLTREDLCEAIGSCDHGFQIPPPLSLFDGVEHTVHAYASDGTTVSPELENSPMPMSCTFEVPSGVRRALSGPDSATAWHFSPFWDEIGVSDGILQSLDEGEPLDETPRLVASDADPETMWLADGGFRRPVGDALVALAWEFDPIAAEIISEDELASMPEGKPLRGRPIVMRSASGDLWLVDDAPGPGSTGSGGGLAPPNDDGSDDALEDDGGGCDCSLGARSSNAWALGLFAALVFARRRRR